MNTLRGGRRLRKSPSSSRHVRLLRVIYECFVSARVHFDSVKCATHKQNELKAKMICELDDDDISHLLPDARINITERRVVERREAQNFHQQQHPTDH